MIDSASGSGFAKRSVNHGFLLGVAALGAYVNSVAFGFKYGSGGDYSFFLPLMNWIKDTQDYTPGIQSATSLHLFRPSFG